MRGGAPPNMKKLIFEVKLPFNQRGLEIVSDWRRGLLAEPDTEFDPKVLPRHHRLALRARVNLQSRIFLSEAFPAGDKELR